MKRVLEPIGSPTRDRKHAIVSDTQQYKAGDVANGHILTEGGQWVPAAPPLPEPKKGMGKGKKAIIGLVVVGGLIASCSAMTSGGDEPTASAPQIAATAPAADAPAPAETPAPAEEDVPAPAEEAPASDAATPVAFGKKFMAGDGNWISVSKPRYKNAKLEDGKKVTVVDITLHNGSKEIVEVDSFSIFTEANYGPNGKTADWAIFDSTPIDGGMLPGKSATGEYAFEGKLAKPVTIQVKVNAFDTTAYFGG